MTPPIDVASLNAMGLDRDVIFAQVRNSCLRLAKNNAMAQTEMLKRFRVDYLQGEAMLEPSSGGRSSTNEVRLQVRPHAEPTGELTMTSSKLLLCTGSFAFRPPGIPFDGLQIFDSDTINMVRGVGDLRSTCVPLRFVRTRMATGPGDELIRLAGCLPPRVCQGLSYLPTTNVVIAGGGIIAIEYAKIFRKLGASVTMVVRDKEMSALERIGLDDTIAER